MRAIFAFYLIFCGTIQLQAQFSSHIIDSLTGQPLPYVNIWMQSEKRGTTTDKQGYFTFSQADTNQVILVSAIGYRMRKLPLGQLADTLRIQPVSTVLAEVDVKPMQGQTTRIVGGFRKNDHRSWFYGLHCSWHTGADLQLIARYFPHKSEYQSTPFLKKISLLTDSEVEEAHFRLRFYTVNDTGAPGEYFVQIPVEAFAGKGIEKTIINLTDFKIRIPDDGFFIAIEHFAIDENEYWLNTYDDRRTKCYAPVIGCNRELEGHAYVFYKGKWFQSYSSAPVIELVLSD